MSSDAAREHDELLVEVAEGVAWLTLDRPEALNALTPTLLAELGAAVAAIGSNDTIGCLVLTGSGRGFCAGGDRKATAAAPRAAMSGSVLDARVDALVGYAAITTALYRMPKPTIAMINGPCAGAGMSLAAACDLRAVAASAVMTSAYVNLGLPGDLAGAWHWTRILGRAKARRLFLMSERFDAAAAEAYGLVDFVRPDDELRGFVSALARGFAVRSRRGWRLLKSVLGAADVLSLDEAIRHEATAMALAEIDGGATL